MIAASLIIDTREHALKRCLGSGFTSKTLTVGDIWIQRAELLPTGTCESPQPQETTQAATLNGLIFERKSLADMQASLFDGRWREQKARLLHVCHENKMRPAYILEGSLSFPPSNLTVAAIRKLVNRLQFHHDIPVLWSETVDDTADLVKTALEQFQADPSAFEKWSGDAAVNQGAYWQTLSAVKKTNNDDPETFARQVLALCPGLSIQVADAIMKAAGPRLADVFAKDEKTLADIKAPSGRRVGPVVAKRLLTLWKA
jgi:ERCC4-type nuclease